MQQLSRPVHSHRVSQGKRDKSGAPLSFLLHRYVCRVLVLVLIGIFGNPVYAQIKNVTDDTSAPIPGTGHDYIHMLNETVNPANGSVSLNIQVPTPKGRGLTLPFAFTYNSNGMNHLLYIGNFQTQWRSNTSFLAQGGWTYSMPRLSYAQQSSSSPQGTCTWGADYVFSDPSGGPHALALEVAGSSFFSGGGGLVQCGVNVLSGGDIQYRATTQAGCSNGCGFAPSPVTVSDSDGTVYYFSAGAFSDGTGLNTFSNLPFNIEDRNGNKITITQSTNKSFSFVDSVGRTAISASGLGPSGTTNTVNVSGLSQPYQVTWETVSANYAVPSTHIGTDTQCGGIPAVNNTQVVVQSITLPNGQKYQFSYDPKYGLLSEILYPTGGWVKYTWKPSDQNSELAVYPDSTGNQSGCIYQYAPPVVATRTVSFNGSSPAVTEVFSYATNWASGGAAWTTKTTTVSTTDNLLSKTLKTIYTYGFFLAPTQPGDNIVFAAQLPIENQIQYYDWGGSTPIRTVKKSWLDIYRLQSEQTTLDNNQSSKIVYPTYSAGVGPNNSGSQVTEVDEYDFGQTTPTRKTVTTYQSFSNPPGIITDRPCKVIVSDGSGNSAAETDYLYDGGAILCGTPGTPSVTGVSNLTNHDEVSFSSSSTTSRGNPTSVTNQCFPSCTNATTTYSYDETGQILSVTDPNGNITPYSYADSYTVGTPSGDTNAYLTKTTLPSTTGVSHLEQFSYRLADGQLSKDLDQNLQPTTYQYNDSLDRLTEVDFPDGGQTLVTYSDAGPSPTVTTSLKLNPGGQYLTSVTVKDGVGHITQTQLTSDADGSDFVDTTYDGLGHIWKQSNLHRSTSSPTDGTTTFSYDGLGRVILLTRPDGATVTTSYIGRAADVSDEGNGTQRVQRISQTDGLGRLTFVCEVTSTSLIGTTGTPAACGLDVAGTGFLTAYTYNTLGNPTQVTQGGLNLRSLTYDSLSRLSQATNPESGTNLYSYDANSNLHAKKDARGITTTYSYDALNRLIGKTYSDSTPAVTLNYDQTSALGVTLTNTIGRLSSESTAGPLPTGSVFSYDKMGRLIDNSQCTPQNCGATVFSFQYPQHDLIGNVLSATNAAGVTLNYTYDGAARLITVTTNFVDGSHPGTLFSNAHYGAFGLASATLGNAINESLSYTNRGWLQSLNALSGATTRYSFSVGSFAPDGNILSANDSANLNWTYTYDSLNRLLSASASGQAYSYSYDRFGNRWQQNGPHSSSVAFDANNHVMSGSGISYDPSGDVAGDGSHTYAYDAEGRLSTVDGGTTASYVYDAEGRRTRKTTSSSGSVDYLYDLDGNQVAEVSSSGVFNRGELYADTRHLATYTAGPTGAAFFIHADWLGTERARTDFTGALAETCTSLAFGDALTCSGVDVSPLHFTGNQHDAESALEHFDIRPYASTLGRWTAPDLVGGDPFDPQTLNRYIYVRNNPINIVDPLGLQGCVVSIIDEYGNNWGGDCPPQAPDLGNGFPGGVPSADPLNIVQGGPPAPDSDLQSSGPGVAPSSGGSGSGSSTASTVRTVLDIAGVIPVVGDFTNAASGFISLGQGQYGRAALSFAAAVPLLGTVGEAFQVARLGEEGVQAFRSFRAFKRFYGAAGDGLQWHHIVEQGGGRVARFGPEAIHNVENLVAIPDQIHRDISAFYSSKQEIAGGQVIRQWLKSQSFEEQREFGLTILREFGIRF
jgi:RHS repeat-associated protein